MTNKLKPCPFCGGETEWWQQFGWDRKPLGYVAGCCSCGIQTWICDTKEQAIAAWNTRAHKPFVLTNGVAFCCECGTCIGRHDDHYSECLTCGAKVVDE